MTQSTLVESDYLMPKMKTHSGTKKRVRRTGSGKLQREHVNKQHKFESKTSNRKQRVKRDALVAPADVPRLKRLLGKYKGR